MDDNNEEHLRAWKALPEQGTPMHSGDPVMVDLYAALNEASFITISYYGGSSPGRSRSIRPERIFMKDGSTYIEAYCATAQERRTFKVARIRIGDKGYDPEKFQSKPNVYSQPVTPQVSKGQGCLVLCMLGLLSISVVYRVIATMLL